MAFNDDFQRFRRERLRDRAFGTDFDKEREMFFNSSPSFQSFFSRRGDPFAKSGRPQSQPNFGKMWEDDGDSYPSNAKVHYIPVHHEWSSESGKTTSPSDIHMESPRSSIHSSPHTSPRSGTPPGYADFSDRPEMSSGSNSQQNPKKSREFIIPIKILDKDEPVETDASCNYPRDQPHRGHSLNDDSRRLNLNRFHLDEGRPHSTPNSPHNWPKTRHASGPIYSQVYEPRKMEATVEREAPTRSDSKEYIIPVRKVPSAEEEESPVPVNVQKLKAQFESPPAQPQPRPHWPPPSESQSRMPQWSDKAKPEFQQERTHTIPIIHETSPANEQSRCESPLPPRQPTPPPESYLQKPSEPARAPTPEFMKNMNALEKIQAIEDDVREMEGSIHNFIGKKTDKQYLFIDEMLTRHLIRLDVIETEGNPEIRQARKSMVQLINGLLSELESKATQNANSSEETQNSVTESSASIEPVNKANADTHVSHVEIEPSVPSREGTHGSDQHITNINVNSGNGEKHISRVEINMDYDNNGHNSSQDATMQSKNGTVDSLKLANNSCNSSNSLGIEPGHILSTSV